VIFFTTKDTKSTKKIYHGDTEALRKRGREEERKRGREEEIAKVALDGDRIGLSFWRVLVLRSRRRHSGSKVMIER